MSIVIQLESKEIFATFFNAILEKIDSNIVNDLIFFIYPNLDDAMKILLIEKFLFSSNSSKFEMLKFCLKQNFNLLSFNSFRKLLNQHELNELLYEFCLGVFNGEIHSKGELSSIDYFIQVESKDLENLLTLNNEFSNKIVSILVANNKNLRDSIAQKVNHPMVFSFMIYSMILSGETFSFSEEIANYFLKELKSNPSIYSVHPLIGLMSMSSTFVDVLHPSFKEMETLETWILHRHSVNQRNKQEKKIQFIQRSMEKATDLMKHNSESGFVYAIVVEILNHFELVKGFSEKIVHKFVSRCISKRLHCDDTMQLVLKLLKQFKLNKEELLKEILGNSSFTKALSVEPSEIKQQDPFTNLFFKLLDHTKQFPDHLRNQIDFKSENMSLLKTIKFLMETVDASVDCGVNGEILEQILLIYQGRLTKKDMIIYEIFSSFEIKFGIHLYDYHYNWNHQKIDSKVRLSEKWGVFKLLISKELLESSIANFPSHLPMYLNDVPESNRMEDEDGIYFQVKNEEILDPRFFLRWILYLVSTERVGYYAIESGALSYSIVGLSSLDENIRKISNQILYKIHSNFSGDYPTLYLPSSKRDISLFFVILRDYLDDKNQKILGFHTNIFISLLSLMMNNLKKDEKVIHSTLKYLHSNLFEIDLSESKINQKKQFEKLFEHFNFDFILTIFMKGMNSTYDVEYYYERLFFHQLLNYFHSSKMDLKILILTIFKKLLSEYKDIGHKFLQSTLFLCFLQGLLYETKNEEMLKLIYELLRVIFERYQKIIKEFSIHTFSEILRTNPQTDAFVLLSTFSKTDSIFLSPSELMKIFEKRISNEIKIELFLKGSEKYPDELFSDLLLDESYVNVLNNILSIKGISDDHIIRLLKYLKKITKNEQFCQFLQSNTVGIEILKRISGFYQRIPMLGAEKYLNQIIENLTIKDSKKRKFNEKEFRKFFQNEKNLK
jgi:hypothetical protein